MMSENLTWILIAWWPHSRRAETFAKELGGKLHCIRYLHSWPSLCVPLRYLLQAVHTLWVLFTNHPQAVYVQNPPFLCGLTVCMYCHIAGARFVLDHHSAAFAHAWNWALPVQKWLARRAVVNIVTNQHWADTIHSWNASALIMGDPFLALPQGMAFPVESGFNVAFVSTFAADEPLTQVLDAAVQLPQVHFYITGDPKHLDKAFFEKLPANVTCTGFLPDDQYVGLLRAVDAILVLTTRDHTLQLGGCEAVAVGQPLITSDWPFLKSFFRRGSTHVPNTTEGIRDGVNAMQQEHGSLKDEMIRFRDSARLEWNSQLAQLNQLVVESIAQERETRRT